MRLDLALVARGLAESRTRAQALIAAGRVRVAGQVVTRASFPVAGDVDIAADDDGWVSRAAYKLLGALDGSGVEVRGRGLDIGASTGGFTQVLLARGCSHVYAIDVGHGQLHPRLRDDPRVTSHEGCHVRDLTLEHVGGRLVDTVVVDVSFISLRHVLAPALWVAGADAVAVVLVKPQFEVGRGNLGAGGVVRDPELHEAAVSGVLAQARDLGWLPRWQGPSELPGQDGNVEFVLVLARR